MDPRLKPLLYYLLHYLDLAVAISDEAFYTVSFWVKEFFSYECSFIIDIQTYILFSLRLLIDKSHHRSN